MMVISTSPPSLNGLIHKLRYFSFPVSPRWVSFFSWCRARCRAISPPTRMAVCQRREVRRLSLCWPSAASSQVRSILSYLVYRVSMPLITSISWRLSLDIGASAYGRDFLASSPDGQALIDVFCSVLADAPTGREWWVVVGPTHRLCSAGFSPQFSHIMLASLSLSFSAIHTVLNWRGMKLTKHTHQFQIVSTCQYTLCFFHSLILMSLYNIRYMCV